MQLQLVQNRLQSDRDNGSTNLKKLAKKQSKKIQAAQNLESAYRDLKMKQLKSSRVRYHSFFGAQEVISIFDEERSKFEYRMYFFAFMASLLILSGIFSAVRKVIANNLNREITARVEQMSM